MEEFTETVTMRAVRLGQTKKPEEACFVEDQKQLAKSGRSPDVWGTSIQTPFSEYGHYVMCVDSSLFGRKRRRWLIRWRGSSDTFPVPPLRPVLGGFVFCLPVASVHVCLCRLRTVVGVRKCSLCGFAYVYRKARL